MRTASPSSGPAGHSVPRELVVAAKESSGPAREELIEAFLPRLRYLARRYRHVGGISQEELIQEGVAGLLAALARYDDTRENCFWTYAAWWVRSAMQSIVSELRGPVVLSDRALRRYASIERARRERLLLHGTEATLTELARDADLREDDVWRLQAASAPARGLDEPFPGGVGPSRPLLDTLADPAAQDPYDEVLYASATSEVPRLRAELSEREDLVVRGRFGFDGPEQPLSEIARSLGVTPERVRQIERDALRKMREAA